MSSHQNYLAPQFGLYLGKPEPNYYKVVRVSALVSRRDGEYHFLVAVSYELCPGGPVDIHRTEGTCGRRMDAIEAARVALHDHFACVPAMTRLFVERSQPLPFPSDSARPYSRAA